MAIHKKAEFGMEEQELAVFAKALAHPARIAILKQLAKRDSCLCGEIVEVMPLAQSTVSQHLKELLAAGLIQGTLDGAKSCYCINPVNFQRLEMILASFLKDTSTNKCC
ncbi:MAG: metalloregulator ArsR/SmtB family transcription factor [Saprospiraceae bacterium]|nr:metalloregulator ArsR/SmtB family transcription factor [Saprospiraceae bacterium]MCF8248299.1 metalloregulator ArsR/SmtB family transcription factor [Saprospiraceae bacterium]MCF8279947.1 metalloregulator ArsR/SmtB family transcription factor [Bacteroidales bacterium]MCF8309827.1 metalloregulator ArsR/SmtB family transcription factor [Saprospiraceae bacterium]MCF8438842.1 metalloregulator ArsR/SmtB family transcription factor [Saprospiraceae bacterium]